MNKPLMPDVIVNGQTLSAADIAAEAQNHQAPTGKPGIAWRKAARALVIRSLMLQEAARQGLKPDPQELAPGQIETEEEALIRAVMEAGVEPAPVSDDEVRARYDADPGRFRSPTLFEAAHILFTAAPDDTEAREKAEKRARFVLDQLVANPDAFDQLAREQSDCPSRDMGGRLGQIGPGDTVPEFESALASLAPGETSHEPVHTRYGLHVIRAIARAEGQVLPFETVRQPIRDSLEKAAWARAAAEFVDRLVAGAEISGLDMRAPLA